VKKRSTNILAVMVLSMMASLMATAQTNLQNLPPEPPAPRSDNFQVGNGAELSADSSGMSTDAATVQALSVGWHHIHPKNCGLYYSSGHPYLYIYGKEGVNFFTTNTVDQAVINPACQSGNWLAFYVYSTSGAWSEVYTFTYK